MDLVEVPSPRLRGVTADMEAKSDSCSRQRLCGFSLQSN